VRYEEVAFLRDHPAWAVLRSPHAPLVLSFLGRVFVERNAADLPAAELGDPLDDELYALNQRLGEGTFPRNASAYLDEWASPDHGWLRKYYATGSDEARYDLAPAVERALAWVRELQPRDFVGTESRLNTIVELLRQMVYGADDDPERRLVELRARRAQLDGEIARAERGEVDVLDAVSQRDRYQQFSRTARELLSDFREVEDNFRRLDRDVRARIAGWDGAKGILLDEVVGGRTSISESDQGRSFQAFYDFLLSHQRQAELADLLERMAAIEHLDELDQRMTRIHFDWIDAAERTQTTVRQLSDQLRRFLDDQAWIEQRRVFDLLRSIEGRALRLRDLADPAITAEVDDTGVTVGLPTERPLYRRPDVPAIDSTGMDPGEEDFDYSALLSQAYVDRDDLLRTVLTSLRRTDQVGLEEVVAGRPLEQGLAELVGYLSLTDPTLEVVFDEEARQRIAWTVTGREETDDAAGGDGHRDSKDGGEPGEPGDRGVAGRQRVAELPGVTFRRPVAGRRPA
jgi:hypothetical protein